ncbi:MAG: hypothetical protein ACREUC_13390 [Steroidobacteraceae bacterium]
MLLPAIAQAGWLADVEVYDRTAGRLLPVHEHEGRLYVAGEPRHQYELRIRNRSGGRVLAVTSVDGVNVVSGQTAAEHQSGYVVDARDSVRIDGWRKNLDDVATFYFTRLADSYAARTGRPHDVGVIGVALFRERSRCCFPPHEQLSRDEARAPAEAPEASRQAPGAASGADIERGRRSESKLGTGHGHRESSPAQYVDFERAATTPNETIVIYYDSRKNLLAQGVLPERPQVAHRRPNAFPNGFVPDP